MLRPMPPAGAEHGLSKHHQALLQLACCLSRVWGGAFQRLVGGHAGLGTERQVPDWGGADGGHGWVPRPDMLGSGYASSMQQRLSWKAGLSSNERWCLWAPSAS